MKILIAGNGDTAIHLAKMLSRENQDVVVMGTDKQVLYNLDTRYNVITSVGKIVSADSLVLAGASECDLFIAVTPFENHNIVGAELAKWLGAGTTIARIDNGELLRDDVSAHFVSLGIDKMVYPEYFVACEIANSIRYAGFRSIHNVSDGELCICSVKLGPDAPVVGMTLADFGRNTHDFHVPLIKRDGEAVIPGGSHEFKLNDVAYFAFTPGHEEELHTLCGCPNRRIDNVMITGTGKITGAVCSMLSASHRIKVIEPDRTKSTDFASAYRNVTVVNADFRDNAVLREEGIRKNCAFLALGDSSETNIVSATVAKHLGAAKTIAQIEDIQYFDEAQSLDIDAVVNKKLLTSSHIYQTLLDSYLDSPRCLAFEDTEVVEIVAGEGSRIVQQKVRDLSLPADMTIAGLTRGGKGMIVNGDTRIQAGDHVVVFCLNGTIKKVDKLFR